MILKLDSTATAQQYFWSYGALTAGSLSRIRVNSSHGPCILTNFGQAPSFAGALAANAGYPGNGFACFGEDGVTLLFATMPPGSLAGPPPSPVDFALAPDGTLIAAANFATGVPATVNAPEPAPVGTLNGYVFEIQPQNPTPQLNLVSPALILTPLPGSTSSTALTLLGSNFAAGENVLWNGTPTGLPNPGNFSNTNSIYGTQSGAVVDHRDASGGPGGQRSHHVHGDGRAYLRLPDYRKRHPQTPVSTGSSAF